MTVYDGNPHIGVMASNRGEESDEANFQIDLKLVATFLGDYFADGMKKSPEEELLGECSLRMMNTFAKLVALCPELMVGVHPNMVKMVDLIKTAIFIESEIKSKPSNNGFHFLQRFMVENLTQSKSFLVPWGFYNSNQVNHAMMVEFEPSQVDEGAGSFYDVTVYNTGSGIQYHQICLDRESYKIQPFVEFKDVELSKLTDDHFLQAFISPLFLNYSAKIPDNPNIERNSLEVNAKDIYLNIFQTINDKRVMSEIPLCQRPQLGGTCTISVIWALMLKKISEKREDGTFDTTKYKLVKERLQIKLLCIVFDFIQGLQKPHELQLWGLIIDQIVSNISRHGQKEIYRQDFRLNNDELRSMMVQGAKESLDRIMKICSTHPGLGNYRDTFSFLNCSNEREIKKIEKIPGLPMNDVSLNKRMELTSPLFRVYEMMKDVNETSDPYQAVTRLVLAIKESRYFEIVQNRTSIHRLLFSTIVNRLSCEGLDSFLVKFPPHYTSKSDEQQYKHQFDQISQLVEFLVCEKNLTPLIILAVAKLNYFAWRLACQWDEFVFLPKIFSAKIDSRTDPKIFLKNYAFNVAILKLLLNDGNCEVSISDSRLLAELIKVSNLFKCIPGDEQGRHFTDESKLFEKIQISDMAGIDSVIDYSDAFKRVALSTGNFELIRKYEASSRSLEKYYYEQLKSPDIPGASKFAKVAVLLYKSCSGDSSVLIEPRIADLDSSPFANLRHLSLISSYVIDEVFERRDLFESKSIKEPDLQQLRSTDIWDFRGKKQKKLEDKNCLKIKLDTKKSLNSLYSSPEEGRKIISYLFKTNKKIIKEVHVKFERDYDDYISLPRGNGAISDWFLISSRLDNGILSFIRYNECALLQHILFSPHYLKSVLESSCWPSSMLKYVFKVFDGIFQISMGHFIHEARGKCNIVVKKLNIASLAAYFVAQFLVNIHLRAPSVSETPLTLRGDQVYIDVIRRYLCTVGQNINEVYELTRGNAMSIGILYAARLLLQNYLISSDSRITPEEFGDILENYVAFRLYIGPEYEGCPKFIIEHISSIYLMRLAQIQSLHNSDRILLETMNMVTSRIRPLSKYRGWRWEPRYHNLLIKDEGSSIFYNVISGHLWDGGGNLVRRYGSYDLTIEQELSPFLNPYREFAWFDSNSLVFKISPEISISVSHRHTTTCLHFGSSGDKSLFHFAPNRPNQASSDIVSSLIKNLIYEPINSKTNYFAWKNDTGYVVLNSRFKPIFKVEYVRDGRHAIGVPRLTWFCTSRDDRVQFAAYFGAESIPKNNLIENFISLNNGSRDKESDKKTSPYIVFRQANSDKNGLLIPSYRFDVDDASSCLIILESKESFGPRSDGACESSSTLLSTSKLFIIRDGAYEVDPDQRLRLGRSHFNHNFIICRRDGKLFALVPINSPHSFNPRNQDYKGQFPTKHMIEPYIDNVRRLDFIEVKKTSEFVKSDDGCDEIIIRSLAPSNREQKIFCAYYFLGKKMYSDALEYLKAISQVGEFTDSEMELLEMLIVMKKITFDTFPEALALRLLAGYMIHSNAVKYNICASKRCGVKEDQNMSNWFICRDVENDETAKKINGLILNDIERYFGVEKNLTPRFTIFSLREGRDGFLSYEETMQYLMAVMPKTCKFMPFTATFLSNHTRLLTARGCSSVDEGGSMYSVIIENKDFNYRQLCLNTHECASRMVRAESSLEYNILRPRLNPSMVQQMISSTPFPRQALFNLIRYGRGERDVDYLLCRIALEITDCHCPKSPDNSQCIVCRGRDIIKSFESMMKTNRGEINFMSQEFRSINNFKDHWKPLFERVKHLNSGRPAVAVLNNHVEYTMDYSSILEYSKAKSDGALQQILPSDQSEEIQLDKSNFTHFEDILGEEKNIFDQFASKCRILHSNGPEICVPESSNLDFRFRDEFYQEKLTQLRAELEGEGSLKLRETKMIESMRMESEHLSNIQEQLNGHVSEYKYRFDCIEEVMLKIWNENFDVISFGTLLTERRFLPSLNEVLLVLAKKTKSSVHSIFPGLQQQSWVDRSKSTKAVDSPLESILRQDTIEKTLFLGICYLVFYHTGMQNFQRLGKLLSGDNPNVPEFYRQVSEEYHRDYRWIEKPYLMAFETALNIRLRKKQVADLIKMSRLVRTDGNATVMVGETGVDSTGARVEVRPGEYFSPPNMIVQRLMAYGKTLVLGSCLGLEMADGYHLSILIPPTSLLETNAQDMSARSMMIFGQSSSFIRFYRVANLEKESELLFSIFAAIKKAINSREFVIMSVETVQGMLNRWIMMRRIMNSENYELTRENSNLEKNFELLDCILKIFRERGAAIFDEIDLTFDPSKDLSFPVDRKIKVDSRIKELIICTMEKISTRDNLKSLVDIASNRQHLCKYSEDFEDLLIELIIDHLSKELGILDTDKLKEILKSPDTSNFVESAEFLVHGLVEGDGGDMVVTREPRETRSGQMTLHHPTNPLNMKDVLDIISGAYQFIRIWLKRDLKHNIGVTMGPSLNKSYELARPYACANTPRETSEFSDKYQLIILTCIMYAHLGLSEKQVKRWIERLKSSNVADGEGAVGDEGSDTLHGSFKFNSDPTDVKLNNIFRQQIVNLAKRLYDRPDITFNDVIDMSHEMLGPLYKELRNTSSNEVQIIIFQYLRAEIFEKYDVYDEQVFSTALDASAVFKSVRGYTGTIPNDFIFDHRIKKEDILVDRGTNEMTIKAIIDAVKMGRSFVIDLDQIDSSDKRGGLEDHQFPAAGFMVDLYSKVKPSLDGIKKNEAQAAILYSGIHKDGIEHMPGTDMTAKDSIEKRIGIEDVGNKFTVKACDSRVGGGRPTLDSESDQFTIDGSHNRPTTKGDHDRLTSTGSRCDDGQLRYAISSEKEQGKKSLNSKEEAIDNVPESLDRYFTILYEKTRLRTNWSKYTSIIDIGAEFKEYDGLTMAKAVLKHFNEDKGCKIDCVLFFDEQSNRMMYLHRMNGSEPVFLPPTPYGRVDIDRITNTTVYQRFVIYGQRHAVGVDVEQPADGRAIATLNKENTMRDVLQGVFRMRKILLDQCVDFVISKEYSMIIRRELCELVEGTMDFNGGINIDHLCLMALYKGYEKEKSEKEMVAFQKIDALLKSFLMRGKISWDATSFNTIYDLHTFVRKSKDSFYDDIKASAQEMKPLRRILEDYRDHLGRILTTLGMSEVDYFMSEVDYIINSCPIGDKLANSERFGSKETEVVVEQVQSQEVQIENVRQTELRSNVPDPYSYNDSPMNHRSCEQRISPAIMSLNFLLGGDGHVEYSGGGSIFSANIYATRRYYQTIKNDDGLPAINVRDVYRKYPSVIYMCMVGGETRTFLMNLEDAHEILNCSKICREYHGVFFAPNGTPILFGGEQVDYSSYMESAMHFLTANNNEGLKHLAQLLLFSWDFDMLNRYPKLKKILLDIVRENYDGFVRFMDDQNNFLEEYKRQELFESIFYQIWRKGLACIRGIDG